MADTDGIAKRLGRGSAVKKHLHNAYRKLGASSRIQVVARARELGLL